MFNLILSLLFMYFMFSHLDNFNEDQTVFAGMISCQIFWNHFTLIPDEYKFLNKQNNQSKISIV